MLHPLELLERSAFAMLKKNNLCNGVPAGNNGPHMDVETSIRNTAHWAILFARLHVLTGRPLYRESSISLLNYVLMQEGVSSGNLPVFRYSTTKDKSNGVIGAAWLIESLTTLATVLGKEELFSLAAGIASKFAFDRRRKLWITREPNGENLAVDTTMNHQLWFAMSCAMIPNRPTQLNDNLTAFVSNMAMHLRDSGDGRLGHTVLAPFISKERIIQYAEPYFNNAYTAKFLLKLPSKPLKRLNDICRLHNEKETGYLIFTLHALARLRGLGWDLAPVQPAIQKAYRLLFSSEFQQELLQNRWSFGYNPPGFEFPLVAREFGSPDHVAGLGSALYSKQLELTYDVESGRFCKHTLDENTLQARLYTLSLSTREELDALQPSSHLR